MNTSALSAQLIASAQDVKSLTLPEAYQLARQPETLPALMTAVQKARRHHEMAALLEEVVKLNPLPTFRSELIRLLMLTQDYKQALYHLRIIHHQYPEKEWMFYVNYLYALECMGEFEESLRVVDEANTRYPDNPLLLALRGSVMQTWGRFDAMLRDYRDAVRLLPGHKRSALTLALHQMMVSDFAEGVAQYALRENALHPDLENLALPVWKPEAGRQNILLLAEQGIGDTLMFLRLLPWLSTQTHVAGLVAPQRLIPLLQRSFPQLQLYAAESAASIPLTQFQAKLPVGDMLVHGGRDALSRIAGPSLKADDALVSQMQTRYREEAAWQGKKKIIGIAWQTINPYSAVYRTVKTQELVPLLLAPDVLWVDMQYGDHASATDLLKEKGVSLYRDNGIDSMASPDQQAAQAKAVDGIITIDNTLVHLAGGLGIPTLLLVPAASDWRWGIESATNRWYPSVVLLRQEKPTTWAPTLDAAQQRLNSGWPA